MGSGRKKIPLNAIFFGDNLHILRALPSNCIDLIYIDPPFFSGRTYNQLWGDDNEVRTFYDIWEDGLPSYLVWLNARLWEMKRVLKNSGSIYVHCDWHASHYIKCEMDKIFGYENLKNEIKRKSVFAHNDANQYGRNADVILFYVKNKNDQFFNRIYEAYDEKYIEKTFRNIEPETGRRYQTVALNGPGQGPPKFFLGKLRYPPKNRHWAGALGFSIEELEKMGRLVLSKNDVPRVKYYPEDTQGKPYQEFWSDAFDPQSQSKENLGYPTQKSEEILYRIISSSCPEGGIVADFFMGGGTTCAVAQKLNRRFIGCDSSRVAVSVSLNRIIKDGEEISGRTASVNIDKPKKKNEQLGLEMTIKPIPDIRVYYMGVYPIEKFEFIGQNEFEDFILTCYAARRFTGEGYITGVMNASTSLLVGPVKPNESISEKQLRKYVEDVLRLRYQKNIKMKLKVISWVFPKSLQKYASVLENYFVKKNLSVVIELIPINSQLFRKRILEHYPDASKNEFLLKFISQASIMDISCKKVDGLKYKFSAVGARSNNIDGHLINCQWDFNFIEGRFAEREYALMREQKDGKYVAVLVAEKEFEKPGKYIVACRVQDNLGGEAVKTKEVIITQ